MIEKSDTIFVRYAGEDGYYFTFSLPSHKLFVSRFFTTASEASLAINSMRSDVLDGSSVRKHISPTGEVYFVVYDSSGKPLGQSAIFDLVTQLEISIEHMRKHFPFAPTIQSS